MSLRAHKLLGPLEAKIMAIAWGAQRPLSVRDVVEGLGRSASAYTTVMTVMGRLTEKGVLRREQVGKAYLYEARLSEDAYLSRRAQRSVRQLVSAFGDVALAHFADELERAKPGTLERLRRLRDQPDR